MADDDNGQTFEVPASELSDYARAKRDPSPEAVANLSKSETVYLISDLLGTEAPDGHPSDHNGNVTRGQVKAWGDRIARMADAYSAWDDRIEEFDDEDEDEDEDEDDEEGDA